MVHLRSGSQTTSTREVHVVTGGGGYVGQRLGTALRQRGHDVVLFDINQPTNIPGGSKIVKGDIRSAADVERALTGADCVYHLASYGMSGREQLNVKLIEEVNVDGTENVIEACLHCGVSRLVYTSTFNVVFGGQVIENGDESLPYLPLEKHPDHYSRTKSIAEQKILKANGTKVDSGTTLQTCALRLAGVYGPGEQRHFPRIVNYIENGFFRFTYGKRESLVEFLHVDNLVQAHILAGQALAKQHSLAAGQPYFISDCKPVNNFEFMRPLVEGLGYSFPKIALPLSFIYFLAFLLEVLHLIVGRVYNFQPLLTRTEVYKTGVTHYFSNNKAKEELGYEPSVQNDIQGVLKWCLANGHGRKRPSKFKIFIMDLIIGILFAALVMSFLPYVK